MLSSYFTPQAFEWSMVALIFAEGFLAFLSPCMLPLLPVYLLYLTGSEDQKAKRGTFLLRTVFFILGFTLVFMLLGAGATAIGSILERYRTVLERIGGVLLILLGLSYIGLFRIPFLNGGGGKKAPTKVLSYGGAVLFGIAFAFSFTPCIGTFLGAALLMAGQTASLWSGLLLLFAFSMGLGVPLFLAALFYHSLSGVLTFLKKHLREIQIVSGVLLILFGLLMVFGIFGYWMGLLNVA